MDALGKTTLDTLTAFAKEYHPDELPILLADGWRQIIQAGCVELTVTLRDDLAPEAITVDGVTFRRED